MIPPWAVIVAVLVVIVGVLYVIGKGTGNKPTTVPPVDAGTSGPHHKHAHARRSTTTTRSTPTHTTTTPAVPTIALAQITPTAPVWICVENGAGTAG